MTDTEASSRIRIGQRLHKVTSASAPLNVHRPWFRADQRENKFVAHKSAKEKAHLYDELGMNWCVIKTGVFKVPTYFKVHKAQAGSGSSRCSYDSSPKIRIGFADVGGHCKDSQIWWVAC
jgi:hypothetical protein